MSTEGVTGENKSKQRKKKQDIIILETIKEIKDRKKVKANSGLRRKIEAAKKEMKGTDESSEKSVTVLMDVEKELWESGDWRDNIKDLNSSFSKLPPICKENKVATSGQAF